MSIHVIDSYSAMRAILTVGLAERPALLERMLAPVVGMYRYFPGEVDLVAMHHRGSGFRVDRDDGCALAGLEALHEANAWARIDAALSQALDVQLLATPDIDVPDIQVMLVLGDFTDEHFMDVNLGMSANGGTSGYLWLNVWPDQENLARLEAVAVHELNHNLRYTNAPSYWDPATVTVGEQVVSEGLADAFARQLYGDLGYTRIGESSLYDDAVYAKVVANLSVTGMQNFAAYVHGDATALRFGGTPVGLPTGAGYAVGNRLVDGYLAATGRSAAEALLAEASDVIRTAAGKRNPACRRPVNVAASGTSGSL
ncbi:MAG: DUF2268 domain-containing protein [Actinomycetota bacterium]|nr:DUF2268 domain-containing protein [Actinomycetota bacterium]